MALPFTDNSAAGDQRYFCNGVNQMWGRLFSCLERAFQDRSYELISINVDPRLEPFKSDVRLKKLISQLGLP